ncbi:hypothetical protein BKH41_07920 [Helicobacter sp. 12S02232-10]|uniref:NFACT family protein n=1 Tax=Helicobacter sp. 12S02232-10 TaxID=1476197 RepID=UPI000BA7399D|nr:NFACT family protein [Helicobacter sp. 12S02232-10]PAF47198.1 hypothetical protein BKH41_07920 [Helicobacter sp. 12S02232-10]
MKLWLLKNIARFFSTQEFIYNLKRVDDNLFKIEFKDSVFYLDMTKGASDVFIAPSLLMSAKKYNAPFDVMLKKLAARSKISDVWIDGNNRILKISCLQSGAYKNTPFFIQFEFTGRYTNVILLDEKGFVLEALRHINQDKSSREVRINKFLEPLEQPVGALEQEDRELNDIELFEMLKNAYSNRLQKNLEVKKQILINKISKKIQKLQETLDALPKEEELQISADELKKNAGIVLANLGDIQNFSQEIRVKDFFGKEVNISLPKECRTPQESANLMFLQSKKLAKKAKNTHLQIQNLEDKIRFLNQEIVYVKNITALQDLIILEPKKSNKKIPSKYEIFFIEGIKISIGRNKMENQALLEEAKADDIWMHIRDVPSSHMIIHCGKNKVYEEVIYKAGEILVGLHTIQVGNFSVDYTKRKFVKIIEGANVIYAKHQTFHYKKPFQG